MANMSTVMGIIFRYSRAGLFQRTTDLSTDNGNSC